MSADDFAVAPMPVGPSGKSYPDTGLCRLGDVRRLPAQGRSLEADGVPAVANKQNLGWAKKSASLPIHNGADQDAHFKTEQFKGWFTSSRTATSMSS